MFSVAPSESSLRLDPSRHAHAIISVAGPTACTATLHARCLVTSSFCRTTPLSAAIAWTPRSPCFTSYQATRPPSRYAWTRAGTTTTCAMPVTIREQTLTKSYCSSVSPKGARESGASHANTVTTGRANEA